MTSAATIDATEREVLSISPHLVCDDASAAIEFYKKAFGAVEMMRLATPSGKLAHGCVFLCGLPVMLVDQNEEMGMIGPKKLGGTPVTIHVMVKDVDAFVDRAVRAGAKVVMPVANMFWGDRYGIVEDPFGHCWSIATHQRDLTQEEIHEAMMKAGPGCGEV